MRRIVKLIHEARDAAQKRGHKIGLFHHSDRTGGGASRPVAIAMCRNERCVAYAQVMEKPLPNEIEIGGTAVALNCPATDDHL